MNKRIGIIMLGAICCAVGAKAATETINWYVDGVASTTTCQSGGDITLPTAPSKTGYTFTGWTVVLYDFSTLDSTVNGIDHSIDNKIWITIFPYGAIYGRVLCSVSPTGSPDETTPNACIKHIKTLIAEIQCLKDQLTEQKKETMPLGFAIEYVKGFVSNPLQIWLAGDYSQKQGVLNLCFSDKISYSREEKFRTPALSPIFAVFDKNTGISEEWRAQKDSLARHDVSAARQS